MADRIVLNSISYHGHGAIENIVPELTARGYKKAFVCSDPDLVKFGVTKKVTDLLEAAGFAYALYSEIKPNPTIKNVQDGVAAFRASGADMIVAVGGGSAMQKSANISLPPPPVQQVFFFPRFSGRMGVLRNGQMWVCGDSGSRTARGRAGSSPEA